MLILTRKVGESIAIGDDIQIYIVDIRGTQVKLGIKAPSDVTVHREEVYLRIQEENKRAAEVGKEDLFSAEDLIKKKQP